VVDHDEKLIVQVAVQVEITLRDYSLPRHAFHSHMKGEGRREIDLSRTGVQCTRMSWTVSTRGTT
jgi:hypothetical protein